jgi:hypothetical protein
MQMMTRHDARALWRAAGIRHEELTDGALAQLRDRVNQAMIDCRSGERSLRASPAFVEEKSADDSGSTFLLDCTADWFGRNQQAITIQPDGLVLFAGWADDREVQAILQGFTAWVREMEIAREPGENPEP